MRNENVQQTLPFRCNDETAVALSRAEAPAVPAVIDLDNCWSKATPLQQCSSQYEVNVKASSYIAQYPVLRTVQSALHFTSLTDLFTQTPSRLFWEASSHMLQLMREGCSYSYLPRSIASYSFIQLSELEQGRVKKLAQGFNTAAQDSNPVLVVESPKLYP